jgi:hypothetical protein
MANSATPENVPTTKHKVSHPNAIPQQPVKKAHLAQGPSDAIPPRAQRPPPSHNPPDRPPGCINTTDERPNQQRVAGWNGWLKRKRKSFAISWQPTATVRTRYSCPSTVRPPSQGSPEQAEIRNRWPGGGPSQHDAAPGTALWHCNWQASRCPAEPVMHTPDTTHKEKLTGGSRAGVCE